MSDRNSKLVLCLFLVVTLGFLSGCGANKYEDEKTGITVRELGSDLDNRWAFKGVVVEAVKSGSPADGLIDVGELISYIVDERKVTNEKDFNKDLRAALEEDEKAMLRVLKSVSANTPDELGITTRPDPEERGVIVSSVVPASKASEAGIKRDTIIGSVNGKSVKSVDEYNQLIAEALTSSDKVELSVSRVILAPNLREIGIEEMADHSNGAMVKKLGNDISKINPVGMEGIMEGDIITHVIDEIKINDLDSYKKAIRKIADADRVIFKRGELGGIKLVVIGALGEIGDAKAVEPLLKSLESKDKWIRRAAALSLERMDDKRMIKPLMWHLLEKNEPDTEVRRSCTKALARIRPVEAIEALAEALKDSSLGVRLDAGYALGKIGKPAINVLVEARYDGDSRVRDSAVAALGNIGGELARDEIKSVLRDENEESTVKLTAIQALYKIGDSESIAELKRLAETGDPRLKAFVRELLGEGTSTQGSS